MYRSLKRDQLSDQWDGGIPLIRRQRRRISYLGMCKTNRWMRWKGAIEYVLAKRNGSWSRWYFSRITSRFVFRFPSIESIGFPSRKSLYIRWVHITLSLWIWVLGWALWSRLIADAKSLSYLPTQVVSYFSTWNVSYNPGKSKRTDILTY